MRETSMVFVQVGRETGPGPKVAPLARLYMLVMVDGRSCGTHAARAATEANVAGTEDFMMMEWGGV